MWQLIILIGVILCIYIVTRIPKKSKYSLGSDNYEMIKCNKCGVNVPKNEAYQNNGSCFCEKKN